jgi:hypothetical protein
VASELEPVPLHSVAARNRQSQRTHSKQTVNVVLPLSANVGKTLGSCPVIIGHLLKVDRLETKAILRPLSVQESEDVEHMSEAFDSISAGSDSFAGLSLRIRGHEKSIPCVALPHCTSRRHDAGEFHPTSDEGNMVGSRFENALHELVQTGISPRQEAGESL